MKISVIGSNPTSQTVCKNPLSADRQIIFIFVPLFALCLMVINQAKKRQMPVMTFIAFAGYICNYWSAKRFAGNPQISSAVGSLVIAVLANVYSRISFDRLLHTLQRRLKRGLGKVRLSTGIWRGGPSVIAVTLGELQTPPLSQQSTAYESSVMLPANLSFTAELLPYQLSSPMSYSS